MTDKAYIVANEQQEREVLEKLEREGFTWWGGDNLTENTPSKLWNTKFPYTIFVGKNTVTWNRLSKLEDEEIIFDGRKEEHMSDKYVVSQEFMDKLNEWKEILRLDNILFIGRKALSNLPTLLDNWWRDGSVPVYESNNRLIAIIRWVNGEDVFEVEKPKKWVVRSKELNANGDSHYGVLAHFGDIAEMNYFSYDADNATKFDTKEEAESWANSHQEVVEVEG